jgi:hypothetical protein
MPLRIRVSLHPFTAYAALAVFALAGCRQMGTRSSSPTPLPNTPESPAYSPSPNLGPALQEIPPMPPAAARRSSRQQTPIAIPKSQLGMATAEETLASPWLSNIRTSPPEIARVAAEEASEPDEDLTALIPPAAADDDSELVPVPRDLEDDDAALGSTLRLAGSSGVELDVAEFLAELEQTPSPVKALTVTDNEVSAPAHRKPVVASPVTTHQNVTSIEPWPPQGLTHGIMVTPGPTGMGNRLDLHTLPVWNQGRIGYPAPPVWGHGNHWAGQNSDWGGRQFR